ncbi:S41 family peptidase [Niabella pedocola]|uniref:S41 family peptidase n=1 Tax=Niabella pedocola TaxID=1752077 RepID=A0ABS8PSD3_9BACT|nr:S41 family peptidase [Niabella pedocola]MCD2423991.1 S41 family peptidase [Niabella pedocola]
MTTILQRTAFIAALFSLVLVACEKDKPTRPENKVPSVNDSMYFLFRDQYLWNDVIPDSATFRPNSYAKTEDMFNALISFKKQNGKNLDKYSFLDDGTVAGEIGGVSGGFGMDVNYNDVNDLRVVAVYPGSPAYQLGIRRTWRITAINGNTNLSYDGGGSNPGPNVTRVINGIYYSNSTSLTLQKPDASTVTVTVNAANYNINPVLYSTILNLSGRKVGYIVFNEFIALNKAQPFIDPVFDNFISSGITDLVVDLRYNGGGAVETTEYLANLIAPVSVGTNTNLMYSEYFNANLSAHQYSNYLRTRIVPGYSYSWGDVFDSWVTYAASPFKKVKTLNLSNVAFIGSGQTASASELLINVLKPYMTIKMVGDTTYGKPVGFVGMTIGKFDMYAVSLWSKNKDGAGDYFDGMIPDDANTVAGTNDRFEDYSKDWGSTDEIYLRRALKILGVTVPAQLMSRTALKEPANNRKLMIRNPIPDQRFKGMIEMPRRMGN